MVLKMECMLNWAVPKSMWGLLANCLQLGLPKRNHKNNARASKQADNVKTTKWTDNAETNETQTILKQRVKVQRQGEQRKRKQGSRETTHKQRHSETVCKHRCKKKTHKPCDNEATRRQRSRKQRLTNEDEAMQPWHLENRTQRMWDGWRH